MLHVSIKYKVIFLSKLAKFQTLDASLQITMIKRCLSHILQFLINIGAGSQNEYFKLLTSFSFHDYFDFSTYLFQI